MTNYSSLGASCVLPDGILVMTRIQQARLVREHRSQTPYVKCGILSIIQRHRTVVDNGWCRMDYRQQWLRGEGEADSAKHILHGRGDERGR